MRYHFRPVTEATALEAAELDYADALECAQSTSFRNAEDVAELEDATMALDAARNGWVRRTMGAVTAAAVIAVLSPGLAAHADPVIDQPGGVYVSRISPAPAGPAITVTLSNGKSDQLTPCIYEDGRQCYWQADNRGNGRGNSFVVTRGRVFYVDLSGMRV